MSLSDDVRSAKDFTPPTKGRISPAERYVAELNADKHKYYTVRKTAEIIGLNIETVRRALRAEGLLRAPSDVLVKGDWHIWLLTEDDLVEVAKHFRADRRAEAHLSAKYKGAIPARLQKLLKEEK